MEPDTVMPCAVCSGPAEVRISGVTLGFRAVPVGGVSEAMPGTGPRAVPFRAASTGPLCAGPVAAWSMASACVVSTGAGKRDVAAPGAST
jgi:hypothetical protein